MVMDSLLCLLDSLSGWNSAEGCVYCGCGLAWRIDMETSKAYSRRKRDGFFDLLRGRGIDIGCGDDPVTSDCVQWDKAQEDAQEMFGVLEESFDWVYSSHCLEHLVDVQAALRRWWTLIKPGGLLILFVPCRDLYEKKQRLPSQMNAEHKHFFLPEHDDPPDTIGLLPLCRALFPDGKMVRFQVCDAWCESGQEYSIECILQKLKLCIYCHKPEEFGSDTSTGYICEKCLYCQMLREENKEQRSC